MDEHDERELEKLKRDRKRAEKKDNLKEVAQICNCIGELLAKHGLYEEAIGEHETELGLSEALNDTIGSAVASRKLGECYCGLEKYEKALQLQQRHLSLAKTCDDAVEEQRAWATIGRTYLFQCDAAKNKDEYNVVSRKAEDAFKKSLEVCERLKTKIKNVEYMEMKARLFLNLGLVYDGRCDLKQCAEYMKQAIKISEQHNLHSDLYRCQFSLSGMYVKGGNLHQAQKHLDSALKCAQKLKDKFLESEILTSKAMVCLQLEDYSHSKHYLKKAHKLGAPTSEEMDRIVKFFKAASKLEEASSLLDKSSEDDLEQRMRIFERLGDGSADAGIYKQAIKFYLSMLQCAENLKKAKTELIPIYISLAQTYADDKQFDKAIEYYKQELSARKDNEYEQMCRTWLNIAECQEQSGLGYDSISKSCLTAFELARKSKHRKLQLYVLKSLIEMQKAFKQTTHQNQTEDKLQHLEKKYNIKRDEELSDDEKCTPGSDEDDGNISIGEITESESSGDEEISGGKENHSGGSGGGAVSGVSGPRCRRNLQIKRNEKGETPLHRACIDGNLKKVKKFIDQGHPVNTRDYCGWTPLHEAANHDYYDIVVVLLDNGADINDRGGKDCGGVTPLIDAANCGNLEVMDMLITRGANIIAKDDEGDTALDSLKAWKERSGSLDGETMTKFKDIETKLIGRLQGSIPPDRQPSRSQSRTSKSSNSNSPFVDTDMPALSSNKNIRKRNSDTSRNLRRNFSDSDSEESDPEVSIKWGKEKNKINTEDSEEFYPNPMLDNILSTSQSATDTYRSAMSKIGSSANRRTSSQNTSDSHVTKPQKDAQPLVFEDQMVDDDWLIDDMNCRPSKKRKMDVNGVFSTSSSRKSGEEGNKRRRTIDESDCDTGEIVTSDIIDSEESNDRLTETLDAPTTNVLGDFIDFDEMDIENISDLENNRNFSNETSLPALSHRVSNKKSLSTKHRQLRMTSFGVRQVVQSAPVTVRDPPVSSNHAIGAESGLTSTQSSFSSNQNIAISSVMRVKVRVKDKLLLIPVSSSNCDKSISWLAKETSQRYYSLCGLQPLLTLSTKDGAFLSPDDPISLVLSTNEEIVGDVDSWDLPPLADRYDQACKTLSTVSYRNVKTIMDACDNTGHLKLCDLALRPSQIQPVFRALQCQNNLKEIRLQGNRIGDNGLDGFLKICSTLPNLTVLDLSCNMITAVGLKNMADSFSCSDKSCLQNLHTLNLSHNPLGDTVCSHLSTIISNFPSLTELSLSSCEFTAKLFQQHRVTLEGTLSRSRLQILDVSYNNFGSLGIELLLKSLNPRTMERLNLTGNISTASPSHMLLHVQNFLSKAGCILQHLDLSDCHLTPDDCDFIIRLPVAGKCLQCLCLNRNPKLNNETLHRILEESAKEESKLEDLTFTGCCIRSPLETELLDSICEKVSCSYPLKRLKFTCTGLDKVDKDSLTQIWTQQWKDNSVIAYTDSMVTLAVKEM